MYLKAHWECFCLSKQFYGCYFVLPETTEKLGIKAMLQTVSSNETLKLYCVSLFKLVKVWPVGLEGDPVVAGDGAEVLLKLVEQLIVAEGLFSWHKRVNISEVL